MDFGDILFSLNWDPLKNEIRKIEKINKRIVQTKNGIYFNKICLKQGLHAKFSNIYIYIYNSQICWINHKKFIQNIIILMQYRVLTDVWGEILLLLLLKEVGNARLGEGD